MARSSRWEVGTSGFEPESPAPQAGRISCEREDRRPRAQTKLPHGPAGTSRMIEGLKTLPRSLIGRPRDSSAERQDFVDEFRVREDHPAATVPLQAELV